MQDRITENTAKRYRHIAGSRNGDEYELASKAHRTWCRYRPATRRTPSGSAKRGALDHGRTGNDEPPHRPWPGVTKPGREAGFVKQGTRRTTQ